MKNPSASHVCSDACAGGVSGIALFAFVRTAVALKSGIPLSEAWVPDPAGEIEGRSIILIALISRSCAFLKRNSSFLSGSSSPSGVAIQPQGTDALQAWLGVALSPAVCEVRGLDEWDLNRKDGRKKREEMSKCQSARSFSLNAAFIAACPPTHAGTAVPWLLAADPPISTAATDAATRCTSTHGASAWETGFGVGYRCESSL